MSQRRPIPLPHAAKENILRGYAREYGLKILVETGTFLGDMVESMRRDLDRVYSIELSMDLYERAIQRSKGRRNVEIIQGDSGTEIGKLMNRINQPALFWLDARYSYGVTARRNVDTAIWTELKRIFDAPDFGHVIIIDYARLFDTDPAYPTFVELMNFITVKRPYVQINVEDDSIRITPKR